MQISLNELPNQSFHLDNIMKLVPAPISEFSIKKNKVLNDTKVKVFMLTYYCYQFERVKNLVWQM